MIPIMSRFAIVDNFVTMAVVRVVRVFVTCAYVSKIRLVLTRQLRQTPADVTYH
jgi:hypothetical protein